MQLGQLRFPVTKTGRRGRRFRKPPVKTIDVDTKGVAKMVQLAERQAKQLTITLQRLSSLL